MLGRPPRPTDEPRQRQRRQQAAARTRRYRARQRHGEAIAPVPITYAILDLLIELRWLQEAESADRRQVGKAIAELLTDAALHRKKV